MLGVIRGDRIENLHKFSVKLSLPADSTIQELFQEAEFPLTSVRILPQEDREQIHSSPDS